jgi:hypothetical protein
MHANLCVCSMYTCVNGDVCMHVWMFTCAWCISDHARMCVCVCVCVCVCIFTGMCVRVLCVCVCVYFMSVMPAISLYIYYIIL